MRSGVVLALGVISSGCFTKPDFAGTTDAAVDVAVDAHQAPNLMFLTSDRRQMNLLTIASADAWCMQRAMAAQLPGTYVAWLSTSTIDAKQRLGTARAWTRTDGKPFVDQVLDLVQERILYPPRLDELGTDRVADAGQYVVTATSVSGTAVPGESCDDFAGAGAPGLMMGIGTFDASAPEWNRIGPVDCSNQAHIYCFGIDRTGTLPDPPPIAKRAFVTEMSYPPNASALDAGCRDEAAAASLPAPMTFKALIARTNMTARSRITGPGPWSRVDGVIVTTDLMGFDASLSVTARGTHVNHNVWFGAPNLTTQGEDATNCTDFTSTAGS